MAFNLKYITQIKSLKQIILTMYIYINVDNNFQNNIIDNDIMLLRRLQIKKKGKYLSIINRL